VTPLAEIQKLTRRDVLETPEVCVRGVISVLEEGWAKPIGTSDVPKYFYLDDGAGAIWVVIQSRSEGSIFLGSDAELQNLRQGQEVEIEGVLSPGSFAPRLRPKRIRLLGEVPLPDPIQPRPGELNNGALRARRIQVAGVVQQVTEDSAKKVWAVKVETDSGLVWVWVPWSSGLGPEELLDAEVRVTGAAVVLSNWRGEFLGMRVMPSQASDFVCVNRPSKDPFSAEKLPLDQLDVYVPGGRPRHRRRVEGTVTYLCPEFLILQDAGCAVRVGLNAEVMSGLEIGSRVEASGFITVQRQQADLAGAVVRRLGVSPPVEPVPVRFEEILADFNRLVAGQPRKQPAGYEGLLVQLEGRVVSQQIRPDGIQALELDCGQSFTTAFLQRAHDSIPLETRIRATGVAELRWVSEPRFPRPVRLDLLVGSASDLEIKERPSWWTLGRVRTAVWVLLASAVAGLGWAVTLRRRIRQKTKELAQAVRDRRDAAIEFGAAFRERSRLAANLHDTILQAVTGLSLQIKAGQMRARQAGDVEMEGALGLAWKMAQSCQDDLRNSVWALNALPMREATLSQAFEKLGSQTKLSYGVPVEVIQDPELPGVADFVAGNLLLLVQEAIHNAVKHAAPKQIRVRVQSVDGGRKLRIGVEDDGMGFDVENGAGERPGHFGISGMRTRAQRLKGNLTIESRVGAGTRVLIEVPVHEYDRELV
jgi:signal transduction histidine kinase